MKSVMISIRPKWCELIANGKKTMEVRKSAPKIETPFKCYIYCTKSMTHFYKFSENIDCDDIGRYYTTEHNKYSLVPKGYMNGKVIGEFVCDCITPLYNVCTDEWRLLHGGLHKIEKQLVGLACLTEGELHEYASGRYCFAWHISNLKIYDKPKALREFRAICKQKPCDRNCEFIDWERADNGTIFYECRYAGYIPIVRPPQSWCYVEGLK